MGGGGSRAKLKGVDDNASFAARREIMADSDVISSLLGDDDDLAQFCKACTNSSRVILTPTISLLIVIHGEVRVYLSHGDQERLLAAKFRQNDLIPFFLHEEPFNISDDGASILFDHGFKMTFEIRASTGKNSHRVSSRSTGTASSKMTLSAFNGMVSSISKAELQTFLSTRPHLVGLTSLLTQRLSPLLLKSNEMTIIEKIFADLLCILVQLKIMIEGDLLCYPDNSSVLGNNETDTSKHVGIIFSGEAVSLPPSADIETLLHKLETLHDKHGNLLVPIKRRSGKIASVKNHLNEFRDIFSQEKGLPLVKGAIMGSQNSFLHPKRSLNCIFAVKDGLIGYFQPAAIEAIHVLKPSLIDMWKVAFCFSFLLEVKRIGKPILAGVSELNIQYLAARSTVVSYAKNDTLFKQGDKCENFYLIMDGELEERISDRPKHRILITSDQYGASSIVTNLPFRGSLVSTTNSLVLILKRETFIQIFSKDPKCFIDIKLRSQGGDTELIHVLKHTQGYANFYVFLKKEFAPENLLFWTAVEELFQMDAALTNAMSPNKNDSFHNDPATATATASAITLSSTDSTQGAFMPSMEPDLKLEFSTLQVKAKEIVNGFIKSSADNQVNIPGTLRMQIEQAIAHWENEDSKSHAAENFEALRQRYAFSNILSMFKTAQSEVYELMKRDSYNRWKATVEFRKFLTSIRDAEGTDAKRRIFEGLEKLRHYPNTFIRPLSVDRLKSKNNA